MSLVESRVDDLEIRIAHQDKTIAEMNDVITAQWKAIAALERQFRRLEEDVQAMDSTDGPPNQKPPHY